MTQIKEKNAHGDVEPGHPTPEETLEERASEGFAGVHILGEADMRKHFGPLDEGSAGDPDGQETES